MLRASYKKYLLHFKEPAGTSRGVLRSKETYFMKIWDDERPENPPGIGECALFRGLSAEDCPEYEDKLQEVCSNIGEEQFSAVTEWSSISFGMQTALFDFLNGGKRIIFPSAFAEGRQGVEINGLIWMGDRETMLQRIRQKLDAGFHCIKLKIGAIDFEAELSLLKFIRQKFSAADVELRVDANGAFSPHDALQRLEALSRYQLHSVEQPIRQGQVEQMARLCRYTPVPIALDEELIGMDYRIDKYWLLEDIRPQYIVLKPALCGGFFGAQAWIDMAKHAGVGWWVTSALESNIGLNALAQWVSTLNNPMPQGLGTGQLYTNNIPSPLLQKGPELWTDPLGKWDLSVI